MFQLHSSVSSLVLLFVLWHLRGFIKRISEGQTNCKTFQNSLCFLKKKIKSQTLKLRVCFLLCVFLIAGTKFETAYIFILYHTTKAMLKERKKCFDVCFKKKIAKNDAVLYFISSGGRRVSQREWSWRCLMMKDTIFILVIGKPGNNFYGCINISSLFLHIYI